MLLVFSFVVVFAVVVFMLRASRFVFAGVAVVEAAVSIGFVVDIVVMVFG